MQIMSTHLIIQCSVIILNTFIPYSLKKGISYLAKSVAYFLFHLYIDNGDDRKQQLLTKEMISALQWRIFITM